MFVDWVHIFARQCVNLNNLRLLWDSVLKRTTYTVLHFAYSIESRTMLLWLVQCPVFYCAMCNVHAVFYFSAQCAVFYSSAVQCESILLQHTMLLDLIDGDRCQEKLVAATWVIQQARESHICFWTPPPPSSPRTSVLLQLSSIATLKIPDFLHNLT